jgi:CheY-like chemotaxis protein
VASELRKGTTSTLTSPYYPSDKVSSIGEQLLTTQISDDVIRHLSQMSILLAEDNAFNQIVAVDTLQSLIPGISVEVAYNGKEAVEKLEEKDYVIVLMDIQMPEMDGYEAARYIRNNLSEPKRNTVIIAMTANVTAAEKEKCIEAGMKHHVSKPFKPEDLLSKLALVSTEIKKVNSNGSIPESKPHFTISDQIPATSSPMTDMTFLNSFTRGDKQKINKYINIFLQACPEQLDQMNKQLVSGNYDQLRGTAHALKPQITYMGIHAGEDLIKRIEKYAEERKEVDKLPLMLEEFVTICNKAMPELKQVVSES